MLITFLFVAIIGKLVYLQVVEGRSLRARAVDQWTRDVPITGERGDIFDRNDIKLADTQTLYTVYARPVSVKNKRYTSEILGGVLGLNSEKLYAKMNSKVSEITVAKKVAREDMLKLIASNVTGVYYSQNLDRKYIYGDFMTQVLGFTNIDGEGQSGVEAYYNKYLKGIDGYILTETDLVGRELNENVARYIPGKKGNDIHLTLDFSIQQFTEKAVASAYAEHKATDTACIVMNVKTGEILAMAQRPSYDLNDIPRNDIAALFGRSKALAVSNVYEPGSTFKVLTAALGLEKQAVSTDYRLYCPGYRIVDGQKIKCWKTIGHGSENFEDGVRNSCNCMFMDIALKLGAENFYSGMEKFGITAKTGIDMSGEASGLTIPRSQVKNVDLARMGFGQAIAVTPLELITACASVVNDGKLMTPYLLDSITDGDGKILVKNYPIERRKTISPQTSKIMRDVLESVVSKGGGRPAGVEGYRIGGKTGTAQKYINGNIARGMYLSTFMGFTPADDPEYIALFIVNEPKNGPYYGSLVAAPFVGEIFSKIFAYKGIKQQTATPKPEFEMPDLIGLSVTEATVKLKKKNLYYEIDGEWSEGSRVKNQIPAPGSTVTEDNIVLVELE